MLPQGIGPKRLRDGDYDFVKAVPRSTSPKVSIQAQLRTGKLGCASRSQETRNVWKTLLGSWFNSFLSRRSKITVLHDKLPKKQWKRHCSVTNRVVRTRRQGRVTREFWWTLGTHELQQWNEQETQCQHETVWISLREEWNEGLIGLSGAYNWKMLDLSRPPSAHVRKRREKHCLLCRSLQRFAFVATCQLQTPMRYYAATEFPCRASQRFELTRHI